MHRPPCPRRRHPAAARRIFPSWSVTPTPEATPAGGVTTAFATFAPAVNTAPTLGILLRAPHSIARVPGGEL